MWQILIPLGLLLLCLAGRESERAWKAGTVCEWWEFPAALSGSISIGFGITVAFVSA
jgi:hypothetical protein